MFKYVYSNLNCTNVSVGVIFIQNMSISNGSWVVGQGKVYILIKVFLPAPAHPGRDPDQHGQPRLWDQELKHTRQGTQLTFYPNVAGNILRHTSATFGEKKLAGYNTAKFEIPRRKQVFQRKVCSKFNCKNIRVCFMPSSNSIITQKIFVLFTRIFCDRYPNPRISLKLLRDKGLIANSIWHFADCPRPSYEWNLVNRC